MRRNVLDQLPSPADKAWRSRERIRDDLLAFLTGPGEEIELWAWFGAYDHVALCQLWGAMPALPRPIPRFTRELRQRWDDLGQPALPPEADGDARRAGRRPLQPRALAGRWKRLGASPPATPASGPATSSGRGPRRAAPTGRTPPGR